MPASPPELVTAPNLHRINGGDSGGCVRRLCCDRALLLCMVRSLCCSQSVSCSPASLLPALRPVQVLDEDIDIGTSEDVRDGIVAINSLWICWQIYGADRPGGAVDHSGWSVSGRCFLA